MPEGPRVLSDLGVSLSLGVIGAAVVMMSLSIENPLGQSVGPGYMPLLVSLCLSVVGFARAGIALRVFMAQRRRQTGESRSIPVSTEALPSHNARWATAAAALFLGLFVWSLAGYLVGMTAAMAGTILVDRKMQFRTGAVFAVAVVLSLWLIFELGLDTDLG